MVIKLLIAICPVDGLAGISGGLPAYQSFNRYTSNVVVNMLARVL